jgi:predicted kinase
MKHAILMIGLPCSGKTLFSRHLQTAHSNLYRVSMNEIYRMVDNKYRTDNINLYYSIQETLIKKLLIKGHIVIDDMNLTALERARIIKIVKSFDKNVHVSSYIMSRAIHLCKADNFKRPVLDEQGFYYRVDDDIFDELEKSVESPQLSEDIDLIRGVRWVHGSFNVGNISSDHKPEVFEIAASKPNVVSRKVGGHGMIRMSDDA